MNVVSVRVASFVAAFGLCGACAFAQPRRSQPPTAQLKTTESPEPLSAADRSAALEAIKTKFRHLYVFPDMRPAIIERLDQAQRSGRYDVDDPILFAERITDDLKTVGRDRHLGLSVDPAAYAAALAPPQTDAGEEAFRRRRAIRRHHGLSETRLLPGNIRYLKIAGFEWVRDETGAVYDRAMRFLKDGDAIIVDLRGNGGGAHPAVQYLVSHFLEPNTLEITFLRGSDPPLQSRSLEYLPAGRLTGKPLYVLIDGGVASAAEAFAYDVQQFKLGELVGETTAGAANNNELLPIAPTFVLSISTGHPQHAISKTNWEGNGVEPTIRAIPAHAVEVAQALALKRLSETPTATPEARADYAWARVDIEARLHPAPPLASDRLKAFAGRYGNVSVELRDDVLWLIRPHRPAARLSLLTTDGLFAVEGNNLLRVRLTGKTLELLSAGVPMPRVFTRG
jgi:hypothetical protein